MERMKAIHPKAESIRHQGPKQKSESTIVCARQRIDRVGLSPTQLETTSWYPKAGVMSRRPAEMSEDRVSRAIWNPEGMRRITGS